MGLSKFCVTHTCGHEVTHGHTGGAREVAQRKTWLAARPCPACWREQQAGEADVQRAALDLPALEGTPDEIAWAEVIRVKAFAHNAAFRDQVTPRAVVPEAEQPKREAVSTAVAEALERLRAETRAGWWIEHRFAVLDFARTAAVEAIAPFFDQQD